MKPMLIKRLFKTLLSMLMLLFFSFFISRSISGDPVQNITRGGDALYKGDEDARVRNYNRIYRQLGFNLPDFYFTISSLAVPDSFKRIPDQRLRDVLISTAYWSGNPQAAYEWCSQYCSSFESAKYFVTPIQFSEQLDRMLMNSKLNPSARILCKNQWLFLEEQRKINTWRKWIPVIHFTTENRFHQWLFGNNYGQKGLIKGDVGLSWIRGMDVADALTYPFLLTFLLVFFVLFLSFPVSLIMGAFMVKYNDRILIKFINSFFIFLYAVPAFWFGTLLLFFLANPNWINVFPSSGPELVTHAGLAEWFKSICLQWQYFIVPAIVLSYSTIVYLTQMTYEMLYEELRKPYVTTLRAKGCSENAILGFHALKNVMVPVLVGLMSVFPLLISGSVIVDFLFTLPGIGGVLAQACDQRDLPVVGAVLLFTGGVTLFSFLITDILTAGLDPRIAENG